MSKLSFDQMLDAGVHFGHLKRKWNPSMAPYIFEEKKGIHIIDLNKTLDDLMVYDFMILEALPSKDSTESESLPTKDALSKFPRSSILII